MKKILSCLIPLLILFTGCLEQEQTTTINSDGSGAMKIELNMDQVTEIYKLAEGMASAETKDSARSSSKLKDTVYHMKDFADTSVLLSAKEKQLLKEMTMTLKVDLGNGIMRMITDVPFKSLSDLTALRKLMSDEKYKKLFKISAGTPEKTMEDDPEMGEIYKTANEDIGNPIELLQPDFFNYYYQPGTITCKVNAIKYQAAMRKAKKGIMNLDTDEGKKMFKSAAYKSHYILPAPPKMIMGAKLKKQAGNEIVQEGNMYDMYTTPAKYEFTIKY